MNSYLYQGDFATRLKDELHSLTLFAQSREMTGWLIIRGQRIRFGDVYGHELRRYVTYSSYL